MDSKTAYQKLQEARSTQQSASDIYAKQEQELGLPGARQDVQTKRDIVRTTEDALRGVESSVTGRTQGSLVTEAQRRRLAALEREPIATQLTDQQGALSEQQGIYQDLLGQAGTRSGLQYQSQQDRIKGYETDYNLALQAEQEAEARRQFEAQLAESQRQFDLQMAAQRAESQRNLDYINQLIASTKAQNAKSAAQSQAASASIPSFTVDTSRGLNLNQAQSSGGLKPVSNTKSPSLLDRAKSILSVPFRLFG